SHFHGIRLTTEIASLMDALTREGIDVYVCTASYENVVAVFATTPKYGYNIPRANVIGLRLETSGPFIQNKYKANWPLTWGPGKTVAIKRELAAKKGYGPVLVAGDSDGDYDMLRDFPDTKVSLIVNRLKKGKIGELSKRAVDTIEAKDARYMLQGRQESTGNWLPAEQTLKLGASAPKLLA
ncbi:MAG: HAD family hydrolase, partial [Beijerinckiaceae bacterium]|nr:HAD family hydrolase [Beijerinckiaceae bacterium]